MRVVLPLLLFLAVLWIWRTVYVERGQIGFWQLVAENPQLAFGWMSKRSDWIALPIDDPKISQLQQESSLVGPFRLNVPGIGAVRIFAEEESLIESQEEFLAAYGTTADRPRRMWASTIGLLYPMIAIVVVGDGGAPPVVSLGFGLCQLGYLLLFSGFIAGRFRVLGFHYRVPTIIAAAGSWIIGVILSNLA
jgi:hypothetical protein